jgi:hypothetical protein
MLGAGTALAKSGGDSEDPRLAALLAIGYGRRIEPAAYEHVKTAVARWNAGDEARATLHLALARLGPMDWPIDASKRLTAAESLMDAGLAPPRC